MKAAVAPTLSTQDKVKNPYDPIPTVLDFSVSVGMSVSALAFEDRAIWFSTNTSSEVRDDLVTHRDIVKSFPESDVVIDFSRATAGILTAFCMAGFSVKSDRLYSELGSPLIAHEISIQRCKVIVWGDDAIPCYLNASALQLFAEVEVGEFVNYKLAKGYVL